MNRRYDCRHEFNHTKRICRNSGIVALSHHLLAIWQICTVIHPHLICVSNLMVLFWDNFIKCHCSHWFWFASIFHCQSNSVKMWNTFNLNGCRSMCTNRFANIMFDKLSVDEVTRISNDICTGIRHNFRIT